VGESTVEQPGPQTPAGPDEGALTPVIRSVLDSDSASIIEWSVTPLGSNDVHFGGGALFLVSGSADDRGVRRPWSVVLKPIARVDEDRAMDPSDTPDDYAYWKREPLAYASGVLEDLPGRLDAPRCLGVVERGPELYWIWLEHLARNDAWPIERYGVAARHLGAFNGTYQAGEPHPIVEWMASTRSVQSAWGRSRPFMDRALELLDTPSMWRRDEILRAGGPLELGALAAFFAVQDAYIDALVALPQTFCHNDALRPNLFAADGPANAQRTIAIDWQAAGHGPIGSELAMLIAGSVLFFKVPAAAVDELSELVWAGYLSGLEEVGCLVDEASVRFGFAASITARCGLLAAVWLRNALDDPEWVAGVWGRPATEVVAQNALLASFLDRRASEARQLLGQL
jgi:hypothetical protein